MTIKQLQQPWGFAVQCGDAGSDQSSNSRVDTPGAAPQKVVPISVFVSRKLSRLFVRQGFTPLFDVPVKIQNPEQPLGTHVFTQWTFRTTALLFAGPSCHCRRNFKKREAVMEQIVATPPR